MESQPIYAIRPIEKDEPQAPGMFETVPKAAKGIAIGILATVLGIAIIIGFIQACVFFPTFMFRLIIGSCLLSCAVMFARECKKATSLGWRITGFTMALLITVIVANIWGVLP